MIEFSKYGEAALDGMITEMSSAQVGQRNATLNRCAYSFGQLAASGAIPETASELLMTAAKNVGMPEREIKTTFRSGFEYGKRNPRTAPQNDWQRSTVSKAWRVPQIMPQPKPQPSFIDVETVKETLKPEFHKNNNFVLWLRKLVGDELASRAIADYFVGTSKRWAGATALPQIDVNGRCRGIKVMLFNPETGKRIKEPSNHIDWAHGKNCLNIEGYNLVQCAGGEHLIRNNTRPVALCESEKTAILGSIYEPDYIWLSVGNIDGLGGEKGGLSQKCDVLRGLHVKLYPDKKAFNFWCNRAELLSKICASVSVSEDMLNFECSHTDDPDIGDLFTMYSPEEYQRKYRHSTVNTEQKKQQPAAVMAENSAVKNSVVDNPVVAAMASKNPTLLRLIKEFNCEVTGTYKAEPKQTQYLTAAEIAKKLPNYDSYSVDDVCRRIGIKQTQITDLINKKLLYYIELTGTYCYCGFVPF